MEYAFMKKESESRKHSARNTTGISGKMKQPFAAYPGKSFGSRQVHYNSARPLQMRALACMQADRACIALGQDTNHKSAVVQREPVNNVFSDDDRNAALGTEIATLETSGERIDALLRSGDERLVYGKKAETDEQVEITASSVYLQIRKDEWKAELQKDRSEYKRPGWRKFENIISSLSQGGENTAQPWFMHKYNPIKRENRAFLRKAANTLNNPDAEDPQQLMGRMYGRDINFAIYSAYGNRQKNASTGTGYLRVFKEIDGKNVERHRFELIKEEKHGNDTIYTCKKLSGFSENFKVGDICKVSVNYPDRVNYIEYGSIKWGDYSTALIEGDVYYQSVTLLNDRMIGSRNRTNTAKYDDALVDRIRAQYENPPVPGQPERLAREYSLGPNRNRMNFEQVGLDLKVAPYRRLGGDILFTEKNPGSKDERKYNSLINIKPDVEGHRDDWYDLEQATKANRFVGGRSNSTLAYMQTVTMLYLAGKGLSIEDCKEVMAFVIADMVVSGEHSMPECMTTVLVAGRDVEPWKGIISPLGSSVETIFAWLRLVKSGVKARMGIKAYGCLARALENDWWDYKLIKAFTILLKLLWGY